MKRLKRYLPFLVLAFFVIASSSCSKIHDISLTSYRIDNFAMKGLRSADITLSLGVHNPTLQFTLQDNHANVYREGIMIGTIDATDVTVPARTDGVYQVTGTVNLAENMSLMKVMALASRFNPDEYTVDIFTKIVTKHGMKVNVEKVGMPLSDLTSSEE